MGGLTAKRDHVPLHAERAEHRAHRQGHVLQHRTLSMCSSRYAAAVSSRRLRRSAVELNPWAASASGRTHVGFRKSSEPTSTRIEPAAALDPNRLRPKRAPSSSAQSTRRTVTGGGPSSAAGEILEPPEDVQAAVEPASVRDGVDVAAESTSRGFTRERRPQVARRV